MLIKQLYRYIFAKWSDLSEAEKQGMSEFFKDYKENPIFEAAIRTFKADDLYKTLYDSADKPDSQYEMPEDHEIKDKFDFFDERHHYFKNYDKTQLLRVFKQFYLLCELVVRLKWKNNENNYKNAYQMLVLFGGENNIEASLDLCDAYCKKMNSSFIDFVSKNDYKLKFELRNNIKQKNIHLIMWRRILQQGEIEIAKKLFYLAPEIEASLGREPADYGEANKAVEAIKYKQDSQYPDLAQFCIANYISEELFTLCFNEFSEIRTAACKKIMEYIPKDKIKEFISVLPNRSIEWTDLKSLSDKLNEHTETVFLERFKRAIAENLNSTFSFTSLLSKLSSSQSKLQLLDILTVKRVRLFIDSFHELDEAYTSLGTESRDQFLISVLGKEHLIKLVTSSSEYEKFLRKMLTMPYRCVLLQMSSDPTELPYETIQKLIDHKGTDAFILHNHSYYLANETKKELKKIDLKSSNFPKLSSLQFTDSAKIATQDELSLMLSCTEHKPECQVHFLKNTITAEHIRKFSGDLNAIRSHLKLIDNSEQINYLKEIVGKDIILNLIKNNTLPVYQMQCLFKEFNASQNAELVLEVIGENEFRNLVKPMTEHNRINILEFLPQELRKKFHVRSTPEPETLALQAVQEYKSRIEEHKFQFRYGIGTSASIVLDSGKSKPVTQTACKQWSWIKKAESREISFVEALQEIEKLNSSKKKTGVFTTLYRTKNNVQFHQQQVQGSSTAAEESEEDSTTNEIDYTY